MINQTPNNLDKFPEPVAGSAIPRGWFGRLVRFINSLILHGDGQYLTVKHTMDGQTIAPTPALLQALGQRGAPASGGAYGVTGFLNPATNIGHNINQNQGYTTTAAGVLVATASAWVAPGYTGGASSYIKLTKTNSFIQFSLFDLAVDASNSGTYLGGLNSICVPVDAGVTIDINYSTSGSASGSAYGMFYT